ncbi:T9SS type A sorting domain-containing protein [candidate division KSB1 bacterium]|nr:T9SS type A sorting domain-containing protein [candidate division KSB1 bacterium]
MRNFMWGRWFIHFSILIVVLSSSMAFSQTHPQSTLMSINEIEMWVRADNLIGNNPNTTLQEGIIYPFKTANVTYSDALIWGGYVHDGLEQSKRAGGSYYTIMGFQPGRILAKGIAEDPEDAKIWRIRPDWQTADLTVDASDYFNVDESAVTQDHIDSLRSWLENDWDNWPWDQGAPFYDNNENGIMDGNEAPGLMDADMVIWYVANDLDETKSAGVYGALPTGFEIQVTLWAYNGLELPEDHAYYNTDLEEALRHVVYKSHKIVYKGYAAAPDTAHIDSLFFGLFMDTEIGTYSDDYAGCDTLLQLGYGYNSDNTDDMFGILQMTPPAFGCCLLQGPSAIMNGQAAKNSQSQMTDYPIPMTFFWHKGTGGSIQDPDMGVYEGTDQVYNLLNGRMPRNGGPFYDNESNPTMFMCPGDPVTGIGWVDGIQLPPGSRRFIMASGPTEMELGDSQEIISAYIGGHGSDRLASITILKQWTLWARVWFEEQVATSVDDISRSVKTPVQFTLLPNYPNPFNPVTQITYTLPVNSKISLKVYDTMGREIVTLIQDNQAAGPHTVTFDGENLSSGMYLCILESEMSRTTQKMVLMK